MGKVLAPAIWLAGMAIIATAAALLTSRAGPVRAVLPGTRSRPAPEPDAGPGTVGNPTKRTLRDAARFLIIIAIGLIVVYAVMALLGLLVTHEGHVIDEPISHWVSRHRVHQWSALMAKATKVGSTWATRGAVLAAAVCLAVTWPRMRWLPPVAFAAIMLIQHALTHAIHLTDPRVGPPGFPHGTFPSGGSERCVAFYGLIAYLLWREYSGSRRAAIWSGAAVAAIAFNEGYTRVYLGLHWTTDVLSGWIYGLLILMAFIIAVRLVAGPARLPAAATAESVVVRPAGSPAGKAPR